MNTGQNEVKADDSVKDAPESEEPNALEVITFKECHWRTASFRNDNDIPDNPHSNLDFSLYDIVLATAAKTSRR